jgi:hypothetical protein
MFGWLAGAGSAVVRRPRFLASLQLQMSCGVCALVGE